MKNSEHIMYILSFTLLSIYFYLQYNQRFAFLEAQLSKAMVTLQDKHLASSW